MLRRLSLLVSVVVAALMMVAPVAALPGAPDFGAGLWADGQQWGTKATTPLPAPGKNDHSYDGFFFITPVGWSPADGAAGWLQAPVMESAPGNPAYNGGRWVLYRVTVLDPSVLPLTSYADILAAQSAGAVIVGTMPESDGAHPWLYFQCPLLPLKS